MSVVTSVFAVFLIRIDSYIHSKKQLLPRLFYCKWKRATLSSGKGSSRVDFPLQVLCVIHTKMCLIKK